MRGGPLPQLPSPVSSLGSLHPPRPLPLTPPGSAITAAPTSEQIPSVTGGGVHEGERHSEKVERGWQSSVPAEETSPAQCPDRTAPKRGQPPPHAEKVASPQPQGRGCRAVPLGTFLLAVGQGTCEDLLPRSSSGQKHKSPPAFRWQDGNPGFCRLLPVHQAAGRNPLCGGPNAGGLDKVCRCRRWGRPGTIPDERKEQQEEREASPRVAGPGGGGNECSPASYALGGLRPLRECPCPAGGWTGWRLAGWKQVCSEDRAVPAPQGLHGTPVSNH